MKRIGWVLALTTLVVFTSSATSHAATHVKRHVTRSTHAQLVGGVACTDPTKCGGSRSHASAASTMATAAGHPQMKSGAACPVSDPSKCPASCRRDGAGAMAANAHH